jgi:hypothetical protein
MQYLHEQSNLYSQFEDFQNPVNTLIEHEIATRGTLHTTLPVQQVFTSNSTPGSFTPKEAYMPQSERDFLNSLNEKLFNELLETAPASSNETADSEDIFKPVAEIIESMRPEFKPQFASDDSESTTSLISDAFAQRGIMTKEEVELLQSMEASLYAPESFAPKDANNEPLVTGNDLQKLMEETELRWSNPWNIKTPARSRQTSEVVDNIVNGSKRFNQENSQYASQSTFTAEEIQEQQNAAYEFHYDYYNFDTPQSVAEEMHLLSNTNMTAAATTTTTTTSIVDRENAELNAIVEESRQAARDHVLIKDIHENIGSVGAVLSDKSSVDSEDLMNMLVVEARRVQWEKFCADMKAAEREWQADVKSQVTLQSNKEDQTLPSQSTSGVPVPRAQANSAMSEMYNSSEIPTGADLDRDLDAVLREAMRLLEAKAAQKRRSSSAAAAAVATTASAMVAGKKIMAKL